MDTFEQQFIADHDLPASYLVTAKQYFDPLITTLVKQYRQHQTSNRSRKLLVVGINGSQGSGKSTLTDYLLQALTHRHQLRVASSSMDDFYLPKSDRLAKAHTVHPLFSTRGVPGTHDIALLSQRLIQLERQHGSLELPVFDKLADDRSTRINRVALPIDIFILEGWCLGTPAQSEEQLDTPCNSLESQRDRDGKWRHVVNESLKHYATEVFSKIDFWVMLKAPSFGCVHQWRLEQEQKLAKKAPIKLETLTETGKSNLSVMNAEQIAEFISYYQRLTEHTLKTLPEQVDYCFELNRERNITAAVQR